MEHLPIHLPYEAKIAGPVQYRWMYPFERFLQHLKKNVKNKARVEGSICNAYLVEEASTFCSHYFEPHVYSRFRQVPRNDEGENMEAIPNNLSIFTYNVRLSGKSRSRMSSEVEYKAAQIYVLLNTVEVHDYKGMYISELRSTNPSITEAEIDDQLDQNFVDWFKQYAVDNVKPSGVVEAQQSSSEETQTNDVAYQEDAVEGLDIEVTQEEDEEQVLNNQIEQFFVHISDEENFQADMSLTDSGSEDEENDLDYFSE
ncbi:hypothetical protein M5689_007214 [Euphorbia peplus]|nr:hypothetical protein M5689_007214 [Euphorbia peplus]